MWKDFADILSGKPKLTVLVMVVTYLAMVAWQGAEVAVAVAVSYAMVAIALIFAKQAD